MKFMNWSWDDLMNAPDDIVRQIIQDMNEAAEQAELERLLKET